MSRKRKTDISGTLALVGCVIAVLVVMRYPAILGLVLAGAAMMWWIKKKNEQPLVWNGDPEDPPQEEQPEAKDELDWPRIRREIEQLFDNHWDLLSCLVFIARADGQMRDKERDVIATLCLNLMEYKLVPIQNLGWRFQDIRTLKNNEFEEALGRIVASGEKEMRLLASGAEQIIGTQKSVSPGEAYCAEAINKIFAEKNGGERNVR